MEPQQASSSSKLSLPIAIVLAGLVIAGAIFYVNRQNAAPTDVLRDDASEVTIPPVTATDHILGNPTARIKVVEYSDLECPFCKQFHNTMHALIEQYGKDGQVAWVYRNFPLAQLHPNAPKLAEAAECVAAVAGNDAYWKFLDLLFVNAPPGQFTVMSKVADYATQVGADRAAFNSCYDSGRTAGLVSGQYEDAFAAGSEIPNGLGTPLSFVLVDNVVVRPVIGAQSLAYMRTIIETILADQVSPGAQVAPTN